MRLEIPAVLAEFDNQRRRNMMRVILLLLAMAFGVTSASAAPVLRQSNLSVGSIAENVKIVCEANGHCYRPAGRPKVARWVYGDDAFYGPYVGPGYYGRPGSHSGWWWW